MKKIVINTCYGGFGLSYEAYKRMEELGMEFELVNNMYYTLKLDRANPILVQVVEELGEIASCGYSKLKVIEIPDDVEYTIEEYDGIEHVAEVHRTWD